MAFTSWKWFSMLRGKYVPKEAVVSPPVPFFLQDAEAPFAPPVATAPRLCELCGKGFETNLAKWKHWESDHGGGNEARKRIFWHAERVDALSLSFIQKETNAL